MKLSEDLRRFMDLAEKEQITVRVKTRFAIYKSPMGSRRKAFIACESPENDWAYSDFPAYREEGQPPSGLAVFAMKVNIEGDTKWARFPFLDPETVIKLVKWSKDHKIKEGKTNDYLQVRRNTLRKRRS